MIMQTPTPQLQQYQPLSPQHNIMAGYSPPQQVAPTFPAQQLSNNMMQPLYTPKQPTQIPEGTSLAQ